ncbi:MAG: hypothetical protein JNK04_01570 [Myxococcales bacterium]|nr:hypothetical protein [Myxococcales bacterium]
MTPQTQEPRIADAAKAGTSRYRLSNQLEVKVSAFHDGCAVTLLMHGAMVSIQHTVCGTGAGPN